jgi:hypothetical protein
MSDLEVAYKAAVDERTRRETKLAEETGFWDAFYRGALPASVTAHLEAEQAALAELSTKIASLWDALVLDGLTLKAGTVIRAPVIKFRPKADDTTEM